MMKKLEKKNVFMAIIALLFVANACNFVENVMPYEEVSKNYDVKDFEKLDLGNAFIINVKQSKDYSIKITGNKREVEDLKVREVGGKLVIDHKTWLKSWLNVSRKSVEIEISMPNLTGVDFSGASISEVSGFKTEMMKISLSGASKSIFTTKTDAFDLNLSGASKLEINGNTKNIEADLSGASSFDAFSASSDDVKIYLSGASSAKVDVSKNLKVDASGASTVRYRGNPKVESQTTGASKVVKD